VVGAATGTHVHDLQHNGLEIFGEGERKEGCTMAVMLFPAGPVTVIHAPHSAASSQFEPDNAVPKIEDGRV
jgi:hypothetical protein